MGSPGMSGILIRVLGEDKLTKISCWGDAQASSDESDSEICEHELGLQPGLDQMGNQKEHSSA